MHVYMWEYECMYEAEQSFMNIYKGVYVFSLQQAKKKKIPVAQQRCNSMICGILRLPLVL